MTPASSFASSRDIALRPTRATLEELLAIDPRDMLSAAVDTLMRGLLWCFLTLIERQASTDGEEDERD